jgi:aspartate/methionine/tyrosine aminotransferase
VQVGALCEAHNLWCISDETYTHLVFDGKHTSATEVRCLVRRPRKSSH